MNKFAIIGLVLFAALVAHDGNLYPHLGWGGILELAFLRWLLLAIPVAAAVALVRAKYLWLRGALWACLMLFLPYTIYSAAEIRHVADWCHTAPGVYFTDVCAESSWTLFPTFIYALAGTAAFLFIVERITRRRSSEIVLIAYTSFATVFGLFTRINVWNAIRQPATTIQAVSTSMNSIFWLNVALTALCITAIFYGWRWLRVDGKKGA